MDLFHILPSLFVSIFVKCMVLIIVAALLLTCFKKLPSTAKHKFWLALFFAVVLTPVVSLVFPQGVLSFGFQNEEAASAFQILGVVLPQQMDLGSQMKSMTDLVAVSAIRQSNGHLFTYPMLFVMLWIIGFMYFLARIVTGTFGIHMIRVHARNIDNNPIQHTLTITLKEFNIQRKVQVLVSSTCRVPFTYGTIRPVILLPTGVSSWPEERLHSVFIHELAHIKRFDSLTQQFARVVCTVFWFIPIVWIAYRNLYMEQEKSCDEKVVAKGIEAACYIRDVLNIVAFARDRLALTGIYFSRGKRKMLEKRILHLLKSDTFRTFSQKKVFILAGMLCVFVLFPILVLNPILAEDSGYKPKINEELFGTWVNKEYNSKAWVAIMVYKQDGKIEAYDTDFGEKDPYVGEFKIDDKWTDSKGSVWYKYHATGLARGVWEEGEGYWLARISEFGKKLELQYSSIEYAEEIDPKSLKHMYKVYYR
jgi:beta-lactamase regulating signal transducer with metallopeptidase domain